MQIIDNFFKNPHDVRRLAISLKDDYFDCEVYSWPGRRVEVPEPLKSQYASRIREAVGDDKLSMVNCYFQWVDHSYVGGSTHFDPYVYTCITYCILVLYITCLCYILYTYIIHYILV